ncbi:Txe/YoeB family addiction module toxin [Synergistaceae bacterium OttesenSCG-928-I11]|nr:Txe/YoeB family addiction module toxin [Synergistaceae bacterium OttesenSCG-928-I11]
MQINFSDKAFAEYVDWQSRDKATAKRINKILQEMMRDPFDGIGKPEPLKHELSGCWSRRIDEKNRILYQVAEDRETIYIIQCKGHY